MFGSLLNIHRMILTVHKTWVHFRNMALLDLLLSGLYCWSWFFVFNLRAQLIDQFGVCQASETKSARIDPCMNIYNEQNAVKNDFQE